MDPQDVGLQVEIVGIAESNRGRSCSNHACCGDFLTEDAVVRFRICDIVNDDDEHETAIEAVRVTRGKDSCRVGFLPKMYLSEMEEYDGKLAQVSFIFKNSSDKKELSKNKKNRGMCRAHIIDASVVYMTSNEAKYDTNHYCIDSNDEEGKNPPQKRRKAA
jgi:hypothetical protein